MAKRVKIQATWIRFSTTLGPEVVCHWGRCLGGANLHSLDRRCGRDGRNFLEPPGLCFCGLVAGPWLAAEGFLPNMTRFRVYLGMACVYIVGTQMLTVRLFASLIFVFLCAFLFFPLHPLIPYGSKYFPRRYLDAHRCTYFLDLRKTMVACMPLVFSKKTSIHFWYPVF